MSVNSLMKELRELSSREKIYREYHEAQGDPAALQALKDRLGEDYAAENHLILPELYPAVSPCALAFSERERFDASRNVKLFKHDCYQPAHRHRHDCFELVCVVEGACRQDTEDQRLSLKEGDLCFFPPGSCHSTDVMDESVVINILIRQSTFEDTFFSLFQHRTLLSDFFSQSISGEVQWPRVIFSTGRDRDVRRMILEMYDEDRRDQPLCDDVLIHLLSLFFIYLVRNYRNRAIIPGHSRMLTSRQVDILNYIRENYRTVTLAQAAEHFHYSESYCSKYIKEATGRNFVTLLRDIRLHHAELLLANTDISVEDIADEIGYNNAETLIKVFRKSRDMTPGQYRRYAAQSREEGR